MANTITNVLPKILAQGLEALRENAVYSRLVNRDFQNIAQSRGNAVNIPLPAAMSARAVTPAVSFAANVDASPSVAVVTLDSWYEAPINWSDTDSVNADEMFLRMQATAAIRALVNTVDAAIWGKHTGMYGYVGAAGTTPFNGSLTAAANAKKQLTQQLAPLDERRAVIDASAEANLILNAAVLNPYGSQQVAEQGIIQGTIGSKLGFDWYVNQNNSSYTPGTGWVTGFIASTVAGAVGDTTLNIINSTASGQIKVGDIFTVGNGFYVVTVTTTVSSTVQVAITFKPSLATAVATGSAITVLGTAYTANLAFHRQAIAFASRPLQSVFQAGNAFQAPVDPISGIALRLELSRQYKQETLSYDVLWGQQLVRPELAVKILG